MTCIETFAPTVVILEWQFRDGTGIGLCHRLRTRSAACGRSIIVIAVSATNEPSGFRALDQVDEYLTKHATTDAIERAFARHIRV